MIYIVPLVEVLSGGGFTQSISTSNAVKNGLGNQLAGFRDHTVTYTICKGFLAVFECLINPRTYNMPFFIINWPYNLQNHKKKN